jgi:glucan phosphoethanolaminetransferase (alkaline phosphatase superfamily)
MQNLPGKIAAYCKTVYSDRRVLLSAVTALVYCILFNLVSYRHNPVSTTGFAVLIVAAGFLQVFMVFIALSLNRYAFSVLVPVLFFISAAFSYFVFTLHITITENIFAFTFETNLEEASQSGGIELVSWVLGQTLIGIALVVYYNIRVVKERGFMRSITFMALAGLLIGTIVFFSPYKKFGRQYIAHDMPASVLVSAIRYQQSRSLLAEEKTDIAKNPFTYDGRDLTMIVIIGEAVRADHCHIYGYRRQTTPLMEKRGVIAFTDMRALYSFTRWAIPAMITRQGTDVSKNIAKETSFISVFKKIGFYTAWLSNQRHTSERHDTPVTAYAKEAEHVFFNNQLRADDWLYIRLDEELFPQLESVLRRPEGRKLIVLHTIGSHWRFDAHHGEKFARFKPGISSNRPAANSSEQIVNSYDNSILYTDYFIDQVIERVKGLNALVIYASDHGEMLGEHGLYQHGHDMNYREQFWVPMILWASDEYKKRHGEKYRVALMNRNKSMTHQWIFNSVLDGAGVASPVIDLAKSIFSPKARDERGPADKKKAP